MGARLPERSALIGERKFRESSRSVWRLIGLVGLLIVSVALAGCMSWDDSTYRFRMTVEVETPEGLKTGSSVFEVGAGNKRKLTAEEGSRYLWERGEAVAVDLAPGKTLFALLKTNAHFGDIASLSMQALDPTFTEHYDTVGTAARIKARDNVTSPAIVDPAIYPMLVTFGDIDDPTSVTLVDPDDLAATFGEGYALRRITLQITDEPVTTGIEKRVGWISGYRNRTFAGNRYARDNSLADSLTSGFFTTEIE